LDAFVEATGFGAPVIAGFGAEIDPVSFGITTSEISCDSTFFILTSPVKVKILNYLFHKTQ
jgi:hypothetical protein